MVVEAIDKRPAKRQGTLVWSCCGAIYEVPDEDGEPVPEFVPPLPLTIGSSPRK